MKSVYSIVLSDDVVGQIDRLAYTNGTSRSNMINQILAEYVSYRTPEKRLSDIFSQAVELIDAMDSFRLMSLPSDTMLSVKSAISYKYNPTVRYSVELYKNGDRLGRLRVSLRTQNATLAQLMDGFFSLWHTCEERASGRGEGAEWGGGKYSRPLTAPDGADESMVAKAIVDHINAFDGALKGYFADINRGEEPSKGVAEAYLEYDKKNKLAL